MINEKTAEELGYSWYGSDCIHKIINVASTNCYEFYIKYNPETKEFVDCYLELFYPSIRCSNDIKTLQNMWAELTIDVAKIFFRKD